MYPAMANGAWAGVANTYSEDLSIFGAAMNDAVTVLTQRTPLLPLRWRTLIRAQYLAKSVDAY